MDTHALTGIGGDGRQMGEAGRANVCLNYNQKIQNALLESIYAKTVRDHEKRKVMV